MFFAAGITLAVMLLSWLMCPPTFTETNDDALMAALAYGTMARPTVFLAYMNVAVQGLESSVSAFVFVSLFRLQSV